MIDHIGKHLYFNKVEQFYYEINEYKTHKI